MESRANLEEKIEKLKMFWRCIMIERIKNKLLSLFESPLLFVIQLVIMGFILAPLQHLGFPWWVDALIAISTVIFRAFGGLSVLLFGYGHLHFCAISVYSVQHNLHVFLILYVFFTFLFPLWLKKRSSK